MRVSRIVPNIHTSKMEKSKSFYGVFLGMTLAMDMGWVATFFSESNPNAQITLVKKEDSSYSVNDMSITFDVEDIRELYDKVVKSGCEIIYPLTDEEYVDSG